MIRPPSHLVSLCLAVAAAMSLLNAPAPAQVLLKSLPQQENVGIVEHRGEIIPLDLTFTNSRGKQVALREFFDGKRPVILVMAYYTCPLLCTKVLNEVQSSLNQLKWTLGEEYRVLTVSFDHRNNVHQAREKQTVYLSGYKTEVPESAWEFCVGDVDTIKKLATAVGYHYKFLPENGEFSHPSAIIFLSPDGKISNYIERMDFPVAEVRMALADAADGRIGSIFDRVVSFCFMYNPQTGEYTPIAKRVMAISGGVTIAALGGTIALFATARARRLRTLALSKKQLLAAPDHGRGPTRDLHSSPAHSDSTVSVMARQ